MITKEDILESITGALSSDKPTHSINIPIGWIYQAMQQYAEEYHQSEFLKLNKSDVRYQLAISALEAIVDPIGHMRKQLKEDERLDGMYAIRIAERPEFYQDIAKKALEEIANCT